LVCDAKPTTGKLMSKEDWVIKSLLFKVMIISIRT